MRPKYNQSFKSATVQKALNRANDVTMADLAKELGVGKSSIEKWIREHQKITQEPLGKMKHECAKKS
jgi:transposase-like protein